MNRLILAALSLSASAGFAATPIDETIDASGADRLDISNVSGMVTVTGNDGQDVAVTGSLSDQASGLEVSRNGGRIIVHVLYPENSNRRGRDEGTFLEITAPRDLDVAARTVSASIEVDGIRGDQDLNTVSGSIDTELTSAEIRAKTVSGNVMIDGSDERTRADVASVSGSVEIDAVSGEVNSQTVSGRIRLRSSELERAELKSVSGSIDVEATMASDGRLRTTTTSGSISLMLEDSPAGRYDLSSFSGSIDNCFGPDVARPRFGPPSQQLLFEEPDAEMQVVANSMSGRIDVCR